MPRLTDSSGKPASGTVQSTVVGIVVDNVDPEKLGRIKVKYPTLFGEPTSFWLRQVTPNASKEFGLYALPEKGDEVLVMFMQGSQDVGVIVGQFWNGVDKPPTEAADGLPGPGNSDTGAERSTETFTQGSGNIDANDRRFWKSRAGSLLVFDDTSGSETVQIWDHLHTLCLAFDPNKKLITLSNTAGDLHIRTKNDLYLEAGNDIKITAKNNMDTLVHKDMNTKVDMNIAFESGMDSTWKAGMNWKCEAKINFEVKANAEVKLEGSVNATLKGGLAANLEGGAMAKVKGGMVMIN